MVVSSKTLKCIAKYVFIKNAAHNGVPLLIDSAWFYMVLFIKIEKCTAYFGNISIKIKM